MIECTPEDALSALTFIEAHQRDSYEDARVIADTTPNLINGLLGFGEGCIRALADCWSCSPESAAQIIRDGLLAVQA